MAADNLATGRDTQPMASPPSTKSDARSPADRLREGYLGAASAPEPSPDPRTEHEMLLDAEIEWLERERPSEEELVDAGLVGDAVTTAQIFYLTELVGKLKARREARGITAKQLAKLSGLTLAAISRLENARTLNPTLETLYRYSLALDSAVTLGLEEVVD
jgi:DNA-binding XRE family transcriptional regulator